MRRYRTLTECLDAIDRGCVVDALDNAVPLPVVRDLLDRAWSNGKLRGRFKNLHYKAGLRYEGTQEVLWFSE